MLLGQTEELPLYHHYFTIILDDEYVTRCMPEIYVKYNFTITSNVTENEKIAHV